MAMQPQGGGGGAQGGIGQQALIRATQDLVIAVNGLRSLISTMFVSATSTISHTATTGATDTLPAKPEGFVSININGVSYKVPFYLP